MTADYYKGLGVAFAMVASVLLGGPTASPAGDIPASTEQKFGATPTVNPFVNVSPSSGSAATTSRSFGTVSPQVNNSYDLGEPSFSWRNIYASGTLSVGSTSSSNTSTASTFAASRSGTAGNPPFTFSNDSHTGMFQEADHTLAFSVEGARQFIMDGSAVTSTENLNPLLNNTISLGTPYAAWKNIYASGTAAFGSTTTASYFAASQNGTAGSPAITFTGDSDTGIYDASANSLAITAGGGISAQFQAGQMYAYNNILPGNGNNTLDLGAANQSVKNVYASTTYWGAFGNATQPAFNVGASGTGLWSSGAGVLGFTAGGTNYLTVQSAGITAATNIVPNGNNTLTLGTFGQAWSSIYSSSTIFGVNATFTGTSTAGPYLLADNAGMVTFVDMTVTASTPAGNDTGYELDLNNIPYLQMYGRSDGAGGLQTSSTALVVMQNFLPYGNNTIDIGTSTRSFGNVYASGTVMASSTAVGAGTAGAPTYSFQNDSDTGMYSVGSNDLAISVGGSAKLELATNITAYAAVVPDAGNARDLGGIVSSQAWRNIYASGTLLIAGVTSTGSVTSTFAGPVSSTALTAALKAPVGTTGIFVCFDQTTGIISQQATNCTVSSIRFKEHIASLSDKELLDRVKRLRAVEFDYKNNQGTLGTAHDEGFIAEEVAMIDPYLVAWTAVDANDEGLVTVRKLYPSVPWERDGKWMIPQTVDYMKVSVLYAGAFQNVDERLTEVERFVAKHESLISRILRWLHLK